MNFCAILGMGMMPKIELTTRNIAQNVFLSFFHAPDLLTSRSKIPRGTHFYNFLHHFHV